MIWKWIIQNLAKVNLKTYLFFLAITSVLWLMMKLSDQYNKTIDIPLSFTGTKAGYMIVNHPKKSIRISVSAEGFKMLSLAVGGNDPISISMNDMKLKPYNSSYLKGSIATKSFNKAISNQLNVNMTNKSIEPDSIIFILDKIDTVQVPVLLDNRIEIVPGFRLFGATEIQPARVSVIGPKHITDTLSFVSTLPLVLKDISAPIESKVGLVSENSFLKINPSKVKVKANIVEFIEAETKVPITVFSKVPGLNIKTFPAGITVKYQVAMPDYNSITDSLFVIGVEIDSLTALRNNSLIPKILKVPASIENPRLSIDKVDFIILNK